MAYGSFVIQRDLTFTVAHRDIFIIMGGSGCGKSTLLKHLIGLKAPAKGEVLFAGQSLWAAEPEERERMMRGAAQLRAETVRAILAGEPLDVVSLPGRLG